jgi:hypothetical protein
MSVQWVFRVTGLVTAGIALLLALTPDGMCQTVSTQGVDPAAADKIEEIIVYGDKSLRRLRSDFHRAEEHAFNLFNSLNSDDEFDIHCYKETRKGSHLKRRICRANFVRKLEAEATSRWLRDLQSGRRSGQPYGEAMVWTQRKEKILRQEMEALIAENPELLKAVIELSDAKQILESEHKRRCEGRILSCRR